MEREIIRTSDGSTTIRLKDWDECYHSTHGAIQEAYHVFINNGFAEIEESPISILEIGFGTGLNAFITAVEAGKLQVDVDYTGIEAFPVAGNEVSQMNYAEQLGSEHNELFHKIHDCAWEEKCDVSEHFQLTKMQLFFAEVDFENKFDLIYFDAFGFRVQPELWSEEIFAKMFRALKPKGTLVTYAARGVISRNLIAAGFTVQKRPGPPGKREMTIANKN
ncbi:MAG: SAM-dependent methyltransferase [Flavobacterium sp.]|nr:MAG: SAM-dependent methyltransferase [Flavobacterium sp.]